MSPKIPYMTLFVVKKLKEYQCNIAPQTYYLSVKQALNTPHENATLIGQVTYHKLKDSHT